MKTIDKSSPWLPAWRDPATNINAFSQHIILSDINGDGEGRL